MSYWIKIKWVSNKEQKNFEEWVTLSLSNKKFSLLFTPTFSLQTAPRVCMRWAPYPGPCLGFRSKSYATGVAWVSLAPYQKFMLLSLIISTAKDKNNKGTMFLKNKRKHEGSSVSKWSSVNFRTSFCLPLLVNLLFCIQQRHAWSLLPRSQI